MTTAIILSAGQGSRLLPLTADRPKCLIEVGGKAIIDHQLDALDAAGVERLIVVGGYRVEKLAAHLLARKSRAELRINPFWEVSSSIGSVWAARDVLDQDFVILNGDTVYRPELLRDGLSRLKTGVNLFVEPLIKAEIDDMLVAVVGDRIRAVSKMLDLGRASHRSLGVVAGKGDRRRYVDMLDKVIGRHGGIQSFHHLVIHEIAQEEVVHPVVLGGDWVEIDRPEDIEGWKG